MREVRRFSFKQVAKKLTEVAREQATTDNTNPGYISARYSRDKIKEAAEIAREQYPGPAWGVIRRGSNNRELQFRPEAVILMLNQLEQMATDQGRPRLMENLQLSGITPETIRRTRERIGLAAS